MTYTKSYIAITELQFGENKDKISSKTESSVKKIVSGMSQSQDWLSWGVSAIEAGTLFRVG